MTLGDCQDFKNLTLKDIRFYRNRVQQFLDDTYSIAENAVEELFNNKNDPDFLQKIDEMNLLLKDCRDKLVAVTNAIPGGTSFSLSQGKKPSSSCDALQIPTTSVAYNTPYLVNMVWPGTPSRFWLTLEGSSKAKLEEELKSEYANRACLDTLPDCGTFVVCLHRSGKFCRGKVVTTVEFNKGSSPTSPKLDVILVDYGDMVTTTIDNLYAIQPQFCQEPAHGLLCCLVGLELGSKSWDLEATRFFLSQCQSIVAIFHSAPEGHQNQGTFSRYLPDYFVSLLTRDENRFDIATILVQRGFGKFSSFFSSNKNNAPTTESVPEKPSENISIQQIPQAVQHASHTELDQTSVTSLLQTKGIHADVSRRGSVTSSLNANAPEFKFSEPAPKSSTSSHNEPRVESVIDLAASPESSGVSGDPQRKIGQIRALPITPGIGWNSWPKNTSSEMTIGTTANTEDDVDMLLRTPSRNQKSPVLDNVDHNGEIVCKPSDELLMQKFLDSSVKSTSPPYGDSNTKLHSLNISSTDGGVISRKQSSPIFMDYKYEASLKPRQLQFLKYASANTIMISLSHVISPTHFYVHLCDEQSRLLHPLTKRLNSLYEHSQQVPVSQPDIGSYWVVHTPQKNSWNRVKILSLSNQNELGSNGNQQKAKPTTCQVFLVDWGLVDTVEISQLRPLVKEVLETPCLALRCRLDGIYPYRRNMNSNVWSDEATELFIELTSAQEVLSAIVIKPELDPDSALPILMLIDDDYDQSTVNELLVQLHYASSRVFQSEDSGDSDYEDDNWDPMMADYLSPMNTVSLDPENYDSVTTGHIPREDNQVCRFFRANGTCYKGIRCDHLHAADRVSSYELGKSPVFVNISPLPSPDLGSWVSVQVTCVTNSYRFYAILPHGPRDLQSTFTNTDDGETLESMQAALQIEYDSNYHQHRVKTEPIMGDIVVCRSPEDNQWYRGKIIKEGRNDMFGVFFVDFGNSQLIHLRDVCSPLARFIYLPAQAVEMFLNGIDTNWKADTEEARQVLAELVENRDLVARIVGDVTHICVDLYDTSGSLEIDIAAEMIRRGAAVPAERKQYCQQTLARSKPIPG